MKKKNVLYYLNPKHLASEMEGFGYEYSLKKTLRNYGIYIMIGVILGLAYRLQVGYILIMILLGLLFMPHLILMAARNAYDQKRFWDVVEYMDQILTAFKEKKRFLPALSDIKEAFVGSPMYDCLSKAEEHLITSDSPDVQTEAYAIIEQQYNCVRIKNIHRYFSAVQALGGDVADAVYILQTDVREWEMRQQENQMKRIKAKKNVYYSLVASTVFEWVILFILYSRNLDVMHVPLVQIAAVFQWLLALVLVRRVERQASIDWMDEKKDLSDKRTMEKYEFVTTFNKKEEIKKSLRWTILPAVITLIMVILHASKILTLLMLLLTLVIAFSWKLGFQLAYKDTIRSIRMAFPVWIMDVALRMQTDSVQVALYGSYETAPAILKPELNKFYDALAADPTSIKPYLAFLDDFHVRGVASFMRKIYAIYEGTSAQEQEAIMDIVTRNNTLMNEAEREYNEDAVAPLLIQFYMPMLLAGAKMLLDMIIMMMLAFNSITQLV